MRRCTICDHPDRDGIDERVVRSREPYRRIATDLAVSESALRRHVRNHLPETLAAAVTEENMTRGEGLLKEIRDLQEEARRILTEARNTGDHNLALRALARLERQTELVAKVLGLVDGHGPVNVNVANVTDGSYPILEDVEQFQALLKKVAIQQYPPPTKEVPVISVTTGMGLPSPDRDPD